MRVGPAVGLIETMRSRNGGLPLLDRHLARLYTSAAELNLPAPPDRFEGLLRVASAAEDRIVRLEVRAGGAEITTRAIQGDRFPAVIVSRQPHAPYRHKTTARAVFGRAYAGARRAGADDALLVTVDNTVAEGTAWNVFWWGGNGGGLCTPAADLGILPGVGRARVMELADVQEVREPPAALVGRSLFLVNAVRGIVEIGTFEGKPVPRDPRTAELSRRFWPD